MKKVTIKSLVLLAISSSAIAATTPTQTESQLNEKAATDLVYMYQEEKLAHDVYQLFADKYNAPKFINITKSEQRHMDLIKDKLTKYAVQYTHEDAGKFSIATLQESYNKYIAVGSTSLNNAYQVGVQIEKTDIADLQSRMEETPADIKTTYQYLLDGSKKHLASFQRINSQRAGRGGNGSGRCRGDTASRGACRNTDSISAVQ